MSFGHSTLIVVLCEIVRMRSALHFLALFAHGLGLLFPVVFWRFSSENGPEMTYRLGEITYQAAAQLSPSTLDNKPLLYLNIALMALHLWLGIGKGPKELKARLYNATVLLSGALVFSVVVTAYRAEASITSDVFLRSFEVGAWGLALVFPLALSAYLMARFGNR